MRFNRVLLVQARYDSVFSNVLPAGIGYISEFLTAASVENDVFDLNVTKNTEEKLFEKIRSFGPDLVGFSMMSMNYLYNYGVMTRIKELFPGVKIAVGGAHLSTMRDHVLKDCVAIDYGVVLEGEHTLAELIRGDVDIPEIEGLIFRSGDKIAYNGDRQFIKDLDTLPYPRYSKFEKGDYSSLISIFSSRGCPFDCTYCPVKLAIGKRFVVRSPRSVVDEIDHHYRRGYRDFSFRDDNFTLIPERVYQICDEIQRRGFKDLYLMCDNGVRADRIDRDLLKRMKEVGFRMIGLGVESGADHILKSLKKSATVKMMEDAINTACDLGYIVELYFLIGAPGEKWEDFEKTVELAVKYKVMIASFYHILPYPNTELYDIAVRDNYLVRSPEEYLNDGSQRRNTPFLNTPEFPYEMRKKAFDYAYQKTAPHVKAARRDYARKNAKAAFSRMGLASPIASFLAGVYTTGIIYDHVSGNKVFINMKKALSRKALSRR
jgi:radical SAM superfamily enzyme YgiQ (UPF0313 family)